MVEGEDGPQVDKEAETLASVVAKAV